LIFLLIASDIPLVCSSSEQASKTIQQAIYEQFCIPFAIGMGSNMLMPKLALDLEAKKSSFATSRAIIRNCLVGGHLA